MTGTTHVSRIVKAPRATVYRACLDPDAIVQWRVPDTMTGRMHDFEARVGGRIRMSLTYQDPKQSPGGKTTADTDTFESRFAELLPNEKIVEIVEFESADPKFAGDMKITTSLTDAPGGTKITMLFEDIPEGIRPEDNELGTKQSLAKLAKLLE